MTGWYAGGGKEMMGYEMDWVWLNDADQMVQQSKPHKRSRRQPD